MAAILKKSFFLVLMVVLTVALGACSKELEAETTKKASGEKKESGVNSLSIATGGTTGVYYPVGSAIAQAINTDKNYKVSVQSTGGSIANIRMADSGEVQLFLSASNTSFSAFKGEDPFEKEMDKIKSIASLYPETFQFVVRADSGMETVSDLKGKKVAVGAPGSGTERTGRLMLQAHGISFDDIKVEFLNFGEAVTALQDKSVDAAIIGSGIPTAAVVDAASSMDINLLTVDEAKFNAFIEDQPFLISTTIKAGTYEGVDKDVVTAASPAILMTTEDQSEEEIYNITKLLFDNLSIVQDAHVQGKNITLESALDGVSVPLHPGAIKYYEEQGMDVSGVK